MLRQTRIIHAWLQTYMESENQYNKTFTPSYPIVSCDSVLLLWCWTIIPPDARLFREKTRVQQFQSQGGYIMISAQEYDPKDTISWSDGPECRQCGKLSGYHMKLHLTTPHQQNQPHISACWHLPKQESISAEMATRNIIHLGTFKLEGVFPITDSRMWPCKPSLPNDVHPHIQRAYAQMHQEFSTMIPPAINPNIPE